MVFENNSVLVSVEVVPDLVLRVEVTACDVMVGLVCNLVEFCESDFMFWGDVGGRDDKSGKCFDFYNYCLNGGGYELGMIFRGEFIVTAIMTLPTGRGRGEISRSVFSANMKILKVKGIFSGESSFGDYC